jgi:hypothetical protein
MYLFHHLLLLLFRRIFKFLKSALLGVWGFIQGALETSSGGGRGEPVIEALRDRAT